VKHDVITRLREAFRVFLHHGPAEIGLRLVRHLGLLKEVRSLDFFVRDVASPSHGFFHQAVGGSPIRFAEIESQDWSSVAYAASPGLQSVDWAAAQFAVGSRLFAALEGRVIVAWLWSNDRVADLTYIFQPRMQVAAGHGYVYGMVTTPAYRGRGIATALKAFALSQLQQSDIHRVVSAVFLHNQDGQHWHHGVMRELYWGRITYIRTLRGERWLVFRRQSLPNDPFRIT